MKKRLLEIAAIAFWFLTGCATPPLSRFQKEERTNPPVRPVLRGEAGESAPHLRARVLAIDCAGDQTEHVVAQVEYFLEVCQMDGQRECELAACDRLRQAMPHRCSDSVAAR